MCAICGIFDLKSGRTPERETLDRMLETLRHRGPDGRDALFLDGLALGFDRLSFIDLEGGMQPLQNEDRTVSMVCNGEIFNYKELREELERKGHTFRTKTDVEVVLHLYEECGADFPNRLNGQFAAAVYDSRTRELWLARDHMGVAPLFYTVSGGSSSRRRLRGYWKSPAWSGG